MLENPAWKSQTFGACPLSQKTRRPILFNEYPRHIWKHERPQPRNVRPYNHKSSNLSEPESPSELVWFVGITTSTLGTLCTMPQFSRPFEATLFICTSQVVKCPLQKLGALWGHAMLRHICGQSPPFRSGGRLQRPHGASRVGGSPSFGDPSNDGNPAIPGPS